MPQKIISFNNTANVSLQVGDIAYASTLNNNIASEPQQLGVILDVQTNSIVVDVSAGTTVTSGMFLLFSKDIRVNESSLKGYYADVTFKNASKKYAELFSISSDITASSK